MEALQVTNYNSSYQLLRKTAAKLRNILIPLLLIITVLPNREIADQLFTSARTVDTFWINCTFQTAYRQHCTHFRH
ncbi:MAG: hypothetical protein KAT88_00585 [Spirochaetes bacterium]|nr:hypothetical protein [Spirochaetota bacterium]